jgi:hypothetical protein
VWVKAREKGKNKGKCINGAMFLTVTPDSGDDKGNSAGQVTQFCENRWQFKSVHPGSGYL